MRRPKENVGVNKYTREKAHSSRKGSSMSPMAKSLGIEALTVAQRIMLVEEIWDTIADQEEELPLTEAQKQDLDRRIAATQELIPHSVEFGFEFDPTVLPKVLSALLRIVANRTVGTVAQM